MDDDPFDSVANEVEETLNKTSTNIIKWCSSVQPILKTDLKISKKNEILFEYSSFQTDLKQLEWDITELQEVTVEVKKDPAQFNLLENDVLNRSTKIEQLTLKLNRTRKSIDVLNIKKTLETPNKETVLNRLVANEDTTNQNGADKGNWNNAQEQIIQQQDNKLDQIGESVSALKNMSYSIGEELQHQSNMLDDIGTDMSLASSKTEQVLKRMAQVTHLDTDKRQWWAILYLGIAIVTLILLNIIF